MPHQIDLAHLKAETILYKTYFMQICSKSDNKGVISMVRPQIDKKIMKKCKNALKRGHYLCNARPKAVPAEALVFGVVARGQERHL